jgi:hypothetical protein
MLDDKVWQVLAEMPAPEALAAIQEAADALDNPQAQIRNINAFFMVREVWKPVAFGAMLLLCWALNCSDWVGSLIHCVLHDSEVLCPHPGMSVRHGSTKRHPEQ